MHGCQGRLVRPCDQAYGFRGGQAAPGTPAIIGNAEGYKSGATTGRGFVALAPTAGW